MEASYNPVDRSIAAKLGHYPELESRTATGCQFGPHPFSVKAAMSREPVQ